MTDSNYTHIVLVVDRSGSMLTIKDDAEGAINAFIHDQREEPGRATLTLVQFDTQVDRVIDHQPLETVEPYHLVPRGSTALRDAWGSTVQTEGEWLATLPEGERPGHVVVAIVTDGQENASHEFTADTIKDLTAHQRDRYGWTFLFLAANQDAVTEGLKYGLGAGSSITYGANAQGTQSVYATVSSAVSNVRGGGSFTGFTEADRKAANPTT